MSDERQSRPPVTDRRWMVIALVFSMGLNLLVIGMIAGSFLGGGTPKRANPERGVAKLGLRPYFRALDTRNRHALVSSLKEARRNNQARAFSIRDHFGALAQALAAEPFEPSDVRATLNDQAASISGNVTLGQNLLMERILAMSPSDRKAMAERLQAAATAMDRKKKGRFRRQN